MTRRTRLAASLAPVVAALAVLPTLAAPGVPAALSFSTVRLDGAAGGTEPRITVAADGTAYAITNADGGDATVFGSRDGGRRWANLGPIAGQDSATIDVDIVALPGGRLVATELDLVGINFRTSWSDDGGESWTPSTGLSTLADTDRQWIAVGPVDKMTKKPTVHLVWHNLLSGLGAHGIFVQTSTDGGMSFGPPVPVTVPGEQAFADLQCGDGYPSSLSVHPRTGQLYVAFVTRGAAVGPTGGCGASVAPGPLQINIITPTRVWVATAATNAVGSWRQSLAVDRVSTGQIVGMQFAPLTLDSAGNAYVAFPESRSASDFTAALKYVHAPADLTRWSAPVTVAPLADAGNILPHVIAGDPGRLAFAWLHGTAARGAAPLWRLHAAVVTSALSAKPVVTRRAVGAAPAYGGTAQSLMGQCGSGPTSGLQGGLTCGRAVDNYGVALDRSGRLLVVWSAEANPGDRAEPGTFVSVQRGGPALVARPRRVP
ncbi:MAG TPA: sialidase family protein [Mycobacteriales bacterium]|nr:sialidase family protein [Mycobacteriales bacterium]